MSDGHTHIWTSPVSGWPDFGPNGQRVEVDCRDHSDEVTWTTDPYDGKIGNIEVWGWFCENCLKESAMDI